MKTPPSNYLAPHLDPSPAWGRFMEQNLGLHKWLRQVYAASAQPDRRTLKATWRPPAQLPLEEPVETAPAPMCTLMIGAHDVRARRIGPTVEQLLALSDSPQQMTKFQGRVGLAFSETLPNWPTHARIAFLRDVNSHWPYWLHFLHPNPAILRMLLWLCDYPASDEPELPFTPSPQQLSSLLAKLSASCSVLHAYHGIPRQQSQDIQSVSLRLLKKTGRA